MNAKGLDFFFNPKSVAIVGASPAKGKISNIIIQSLKASGFPGAVYPVNPNYPVVEGAECYRSIAAINEDIDIAVFAVPAASTPDALRQAGTRVKGAIIVGGGFSEMGQEGGRLQEEIKAIARERSIRVIGPNCMGIYDAVSRLDTFFLPPERIRRPAKGVLSIISQSGSFAVTAMDELAAEGIGIARVVSYGNKADVNETDCLKFLAGDGHTGAVALYIESIEDGAGFIEAARECALKKPVIALKVGRYGAGASAARSHTGAMAGRYEAYRAAFKKAGVVELGGYEDFVNGCKAFGSLRPASGNRAVIITDGGGIGVDLADTCQAMGLKVPRLDIALTRALEAVFPPFFIASNPVDLTGSATDALYAEALEKTLSTDSFDIAIVVALWGPPGLTDGFAGAIASKASSIGKPVVVCAPGGAWSREKNRLFMEYGLPVFPTPEGAARAASILSRAKGVHGQS